MIESDNKLTSEQVDEFIRSSLVKIGVKVKVELVVSDVRHQLTHQRLHADFYCLTLSHKTVNGQWSNGHWVKESDIDRYALPRLLEKLMEKMKEGRPNS